MADTERALALGQEARLFVRNHQNGVLSTLSKRLDGFPFGSVSPYVLDHDNMVISLINRKEIRLQHFVYNALEDDETEQTRARRLRRAGFRRRGIRAPRE